MSGKQQELLMEHTENLNIQEKIDNGQCMLVWNTKGKSAVWEKFLMIKNSETNRNSGYVQCKLCKKILQYKGKSGTSHLIRHACRTIMNDISTNDRRKILEKCTEYCLRDVQPVSNLGGEGFKKLVQTIINIGCRYGSVSVKNILPSPTTLVRYLLRLTDKTRNHILPEVLNAVQSGTCAAAIDVWSDNCIEISYYTVTLYYIDESWNLKRRVLFTTDLPDDGKTAKNIRFELHRKFEEFGIPSDMLQYITFVTDQDDNVIKALKGFDRLDCAIYGITSCLCSVFNEQFLSEHAPMLWQTLEQTRSIVAYLKRSEPEPEPEHEHEHEHELEPGSEPGSGSGSGYESRLPNLLQEETENRWCSKVAMLRSVAKQYTQIVDTFADSNESSKLDGYDLKKVEDLIEFLEPFENAIAILEVNASPTLYLVLLWLKKLMKQCSDNVNDSPEMERIKRATKDSLQEKLIVHKYCKMATYLVPAFRKLRMLTEGERAEVVQHVRDLIVDSLIDVKTEEPVASTSHEGPELKRLRSIFEEWADPDKVPVNCSDEITTYTNVESRRNDDLLQWWKEKTSLLPQLSSIARKLFAIPASSAPNEESVKRAEYILVERISCTKPEIINAILFLHNNPPEEEGID